MGRARIGHRPVRRRAAGRRRRADRARAAAPDPVGGRSTTDSWWSSPASRTWRSPRPSRPTHFYPPDPSSQIVCSIGGNVAENSGGAHCFKYGFTTNYVIGLEVVLSDGTVVDLRRDDPGYDLLGAFVGSEGTLGVATKISLRVVPAPESVETMLAFFEDTGAAGDAVSAIVEEGLVPGRDRDDGPALDRGRRAGDRRRLPPRRRSGAAGRARRRPRGVPRRDSNG